MRRKTSFIKFIKLWGIVFLLAMAGIIVSLDIVISYRDFNVRAEKMREDYIAHQKDMIRQEVYRVIDMINFARSQSEELTRKKIRGRVYEAYSIAENIYEQNRGTRSRAEIQKMILDALRPVRYENGTGYYFATSLEGIEVLFADKPEMEGMDLLDMRDTKGRYVIRDMIEIAKRRGEGFYEYHWTKPGVQGNDYKKISFIKLFEPYGWFIGTGLYVDDIKELISEHILSTISQIRFGREGYIFVNRFNGDALVSNGRLFSGKKKLWEVFDDDPERVKDVFKMEYDAALKAEGDYIYYSHVKLSNPDEDAPKVSFVCVITDLQWIIGAGVYLDDVERDIALMQAELNRQIRSKMFSSVLAAMGIAALFLLLFNWLTRRFKNDFNLFVSFFGRAAFSDEPVDLEKVRFIEFERMAKNANKMLQDKIRVQRELLEEREQLFVTIRSIGDGVITTDRSGRVELMNTVAEELTGWKAGEARGRPLTEVFDIINEDTRKVVGNPVGKVLTEGRIVGLANHTVLISRNGTEYNIADSAAPIRDMDGDIRGVVLVFRDVTGKKMMEQKILKSEKLESVGVLAGGIAHDFNNILTGLFGNLEIAKMKIPRDHEAYSYMETANKALERATHLTKQLLTFARGGDPILEAVDLKSVVQTTVNFNLAGSNVKARFNLPDDLWKVKADKGQISQVIANLTINAKEAMPDGGCLYIDAENLREHSESAVRHLKGDFVKLSIRDEGTGIPTKYVKRIFDPYFSTKQTGSGLGLAVVHSIVDKHDGHILVDSRPGVGTTFTIYLSAERHSSDQAPADSPDLADREKTESGRVLVMDDEELVRKVALAMLGACGYSGDVAVDGKEAIEKYADAEKSGRPFDVVIMDLTVPGGIGGKEAIDMLLDIDPGARVIVSSGYSTDPIMANYGDYGFKGRLVKPFLIEDLKRELARVMQEGGSER